ncbi:MAG: hypothetical protein Q8O88_00860 [bacterium]|nr:hypothetical protein [bacterium]
MRKCRGGKTIPNPETIKDKSDIEKVIASLEEFERMHGTPAVVVKRQNLSFGSSYDIISMEEANRRLGKWEGSETYLKYWPKEFFYQLK